MKKARMRRARSLATSGENNSPNLDRCTYKSSFVLHFFCLFFVFVVSPSLFAPTTVPVEMLAVFLENQDKHKQEDHRTRLRKKPRSSHHG